MKKLQFVTIVLICTILNSCITPEDEAMKNDISNTNVPLVLFLGDTIVVPLQPSGNSVSDGGFQIETNYGKIVNDTMLVLTNNGNELGKKLIQLTLPGIDSCQFPVNILPVKNLEKGDHWKYEEIHEFSGVMNGIKKTTTLEITAEDINSKELLIRTSLRYYKESYPGLGVDTLYSLFVDTSYAFNIDSLRDIVFTNENHSISSKDFITQVLATRILKNYTLSPQNSLLEIESLEEVTFKDKQYWSLHLKRYVDFHGDLRFYSSQSILPGVGVTSLFHDYNVLPFSDYYEVKKTNLISMNGAHYE